MRIAILSCSERDGGKTDAISTLVSAYAARTKNEAKVFYLRNYNIIPCGACGDCNYRRIRCSVDDDVHPLLEELLNYEALIYAAPVHVYGLSHPLQVFMERAGVGFLRFNRPFENKFGGIIVVGRRYGHLAVYNQISLNMYLNRMLIVGSGFPPIIRVSENQDVKSDKEGVSAAFHMIDRMVYLNERIDISKSDNVRVAMNERNLIKYYQTNYSDLIEEN